MKSIKNLVMEMIQRQKEEIELSRKLLKQVRRLTLLAESNHLSLSKMDGLYLEGKERKERNYIFTEEDVLFLLDTCEKLLASIDSHSPIRELVLHFREKLLSLTGFTPLARIGNQYESTDKSSNSYTIVDGEMNSQVPVGTILRILSQGYRRADSSLARTAKVIVSRDRESL